MNMDTVRSLLNNYRWQLYMAPFFVASIWLALTLHVAKNQTEFAIISVLYALADIMIVNFFVVGSRRIKAFSIVGASTIFFAIFLYTYVVHGEVQYVFTQPLFLAATWKLAARELKPTAYPSFLTEKVVATYWVVTLVAACVVFVRLDVIPTVVNLIQLVGLSLFGLYLAIGDDVVASRKEFVHLLGTIGVGTYTAFCLVDVWYKWYMTGEFIATPFVAFFASLPVAIVALREDILIIRKKL